MKLNVKYGRMYMELFLLSLRTLAHEIFVLSYFSDKPMPSERLISITILFRMPLPAAFIGSSCGLYNQPISFRFLQKYNHVFVYCNRYVLEPWLITLHIYLKSIWIIATLQCLLFFILRLVFQLSLFFLFNSFPSRFIFRFRLFYYTLNSVSSLLRPLYEPYQAP